MVIHSNDKQNKSQITQYARAFFNNWVSLMSGVASIVFSIWSLWTEANNSKLKYGLLLTGIICFVIGSYRIWAERNMEVQRLQREIDLLNNLSIREFNEIKSRILFSKIVNDIDVELKNLQDFFQANYDLFNRKDVSNFYQLYIEPYYIHLRFGAALELKGKEYQQIKISLSKIDLSADDNGGELLQPLNQKELLSPPQNEIQLN